MGRTLQLRNIVPCLEHHGRTFGHGMLDPEPEIHKAKQKLRDNNRLFVDQVDAQHQRAMHVRQSREHIHDAPFFAG